MTLFEQIKHANDECDTLAEWAALWYKVVVSMIFVIPLLFIAGFLSGMLMLKNPIASGVGIIKAVY